MADLSLVFDLLARDKGASAAFDKVGDSARKAGEGGDRFGSLIKTGIGVAAGALLAGGIVSTFEGFYSAAAESAKIGKLTENVIKTTGAAAGLTADQVGDLATALSNKTGQDDEAIQGAENLLLTFTKVRNETGKGNDVFSQATGLALDMSTALGTDASGAAMQLGKALNDPVKGVAALGRAGVSFTADQKKTIASLVKSGDVLGAQKIILAEVGKEFGGAAEAAATPMDRLKVVAGNLQEQIGGALIPVFDKVAGAASQVIGILFSGDFTAGPFSEDSPIVGTLFNLRDAAIAAGQWISHDLWPALQNIGGWMTEHQTTVAVIAGLIGGVLVAAFTVWGARAVIAAAQNVGAWISATIAASAGAGTQELSALQVIAAWSLMGARAVINGVRIAVVWAAQTAWATTTLVAGWAWAAVSTLASWALLGAQALIRGVGIAAVWTAQTAATVGPMILAWGIAAATIVGGWVVMGVQSLLQAARMAAAWLIAMGPVGWAIAAVIGLVALVIANWDQVKAFTVAAWGAVVGFVVGAWEWIKGAVAAAFTFLLDLFLHWTPLGIIISHWEQIKGAFLAGVNAVVGFVTQLPGRVLAGLAGFGSLLVSAGGDLLRGLWNGISGATRWLLGKVGDFFGNLLPDWVEHMLGISSPSKVFAGFGRQAMLGFAGGIDAGAGAAVGAVGRAIAGAAGAADFGGLGYSPPGYDLTGGPGGPGGGARHTTIVSGVVGPEEVAAIVRRDQATTEFLAGA